MICILFLRKYLIMQGSLTIKVTRGTTGRSGYHQKNDKPTSNYEVQEFVKKLCNSKIKPIWPFVLIKSLLAWKLLLQIRLASKIGLKGQYFRSRTFSRKDEEPSSNCMGAPPIEKQGNGRYTEGSGVVLYLSKTPEIAATESSPSEDEQRIFIQEFCLNITKLRVLYLTSNLEDKYPLIHYLLLNSEFIINETSGLENPYRATQFISFLCRLCGVNAVEYPIVKGNFKTKPNAINLVIFNRYVSEATSMMNGNPFEFKGN
jgi:hypothetical protein